jgi:hypothetical protein
MAGHEGRYPHRNRVPVQQSYTKSSGPWPWRPLRPGDSGTALFGCWNRHVQRSTGAIWNELAIQVSVSSLRGRYLSTSSADPAPWGSNATALLPNTFVRMRQGPLLIQDWTEVLNCLISHRTYFHTHNTSISRAAGRHSCEDDSLLGYSAV